MTQTTQRANAKATPLTRAENYISSSIAGVNVAVRSGWYKDRESGLTLRRPLERAGSDNCDVIVVIHPRASLVSFYGAQLDSHRRNS